MTRVVEIDTRELTVTPVFKMMNLENVPKSEEAGHAVMEMREMVEVRFAGSNNYSPVFPSDGFWKREGNKVITYAERWPDQYVAFKQGNPQEASGTPLEMLRPYGITPEQLSLCRALKIYSIEALHHLEGTSLKNLGMMGNNLKDQCRKYMADRGRGMEATTEIEELKRQIAELQSRSTVPPVVEATPTEIENVQLEADLAAMDEPALRGMIEKVTGQKPDGRLSHASLVNMAKGL